jgi:hypothetical protein
MSQSTHITATSTTTPAVIPSQGDLRHPPIFTVLTHAVTMEIAQPVTGSQNATFWPALLQMKKSSSGRHESLLIAPAAPSPNAMIPPVMANSQQIVANPTRRDDEPCVVRNPSDVCLEIASPFPSTAQTAYFVAGTDDGPACFLTSAAI